MDSTVFPLLPAWFWLGVSLVFGLLVGSFLNVVGLRLLSGESPAYPPSHCPKCKTPIRPWDNIPVISYLLLGGQCRSCKVPISIQYPLIELTTGFLFCATVWEFGLSWQTLFILFVIANLMVILITDWLESLIFEINSLWLAPVGLLYAWLNLGGVVAEPFTLPLGGAHLDVPWPVISGLLGMVIAIAIFEGGNLISKLVLGNDGFGRGDTYMMMGLAPFLGWELTALAIFLGFVIQAASAFPLLFWGWFQQKEWTSILSMAGVLVFGLGPVWMRYAIGETPYFAIAMLVSVILALGCMVVFIRRMREVQQYSYMPLGPSLVFGTLVVLFFGSEAIQLYQTVILHQK